MLISLLQLIDDTEKMRKYLFWYWIITPAAIFAWIMLGAGNAGTDLRGTLNNPFFAVAFLHACWTLLMAGLLKLAGIENESTERTFALYALIMELVTGNIIGASLSFFLFRSLRFTEREEFAPKYRWILIAAMVFMALVAAMILTANISLFA